MPQTPPPPQAVPVFQQQQQQQSPVAVESSTNNNTKNTSDSESTSVSNPAAYLSATQIVNNNTGIFSFGNGISRPSTTVNLTGYMDGGDGFGTRYGAAITLTKSFGGKAKRLSDELIEARNRQLRIENEARISKVCANIAEQGLTLNYNQLHESSELHECNGMFLVAEAKSEASAILEEVRAMRAANQHLLGIVEGLERRNRSLKNQLRQVYSQPQTPLNDGE